jgi:hypothetical protein
MRTDGVKPASGDPLGNPSPLGRPAKPGKSFAEALEKAKAAAATSPAGKPAPPSVPAAGEETYLDSIKGRMRAGFYSSQKVDEAISEKLSGYFDELA